ncbi:unnamed protein product, partial [Rotaria sp. Silwood2]
MELNLRIGSDGGGLWWASV